MLPYMEEDLGSAVKFRSLSGRVPWTIQMVWKREAEGERRDVMPESEVGEMQLLALKKEGATAKHCGWPLRAGKQAVP